MPDYSQWLTELSKREGASVEQSDLERLRNTNPDDLPRLQAALTEQYKRRGQSGQTGSGTDSTALTAQGYGSGRDESQGSAFAPTPSSGGGSGSGGGTVAQQWNSTPTATPPMAGQSTELWQMLMDRAQQGLDVDRNTPAIRAQADAFSANQERARRNYISDVAERSGPLANIQGERRMAAERAGIASGAFESELIGREVEARRNEIAQALAGLSGRLTSEQEMALRRELAELDATLSREGMGLQRYGLDLGFDQFLRQMAQRQYEFDNPFFY